MIWFLSVGVIFLLVLSHPPQANAIILLPAVILIPIAKIIALLIGGFSLPALGLTAIWSKLFRKSFRRTVTVTILLLLILTVFIGIVLKLSNPDRPLF